MYKLLNETFYQMLVKPFNGRIDKLNHFFNEKEYIEFIRQYTSLISRFLTLSYNNYNEIIIIILV